MKINSKLTTTNIPLTQRNNDVRVRNYDVYKSKLAVGIQAAKWDKNP